MSVSSSRIAQLIDTSPAIQFRSIASGADVGEGYHGLMPKRIGRGNAFWQDTETNALDGVLIVEGQVVSIDSGATYAIVVKAGATSGSITEIARVEVANIGPWSLSIDPALFGDADEWLGVGVEISGEPNAINWSAQLRYVAA